MTSEQEIERQKTGKDVYWLLEIDFRSPLGTQYFGTRRITISGNFYDDKLVAFSDGGKVIPVGFNPNNVLGVVSGFDFRVRNLPEDTNRFSDLITDYGLDGYVARFGFVFKPPSGTPTSADITWYHTYLIDSFTIGTQEVPVRCVDIVEFFMDKILGRVVTDNDYPRAPQESYGRYIPIIFGPVLDCPGIAVDIGSRTLLNGSLLFDETVISVVDVSEFPDPGAGGYQIQIEKELILVRVIDRINKTFGTEGSPCERGYGGTDAEGYIDGTAVHEILSNYIYLLADHKLKSVGNVRVGGRAITSGFEDYYDAVLGRHYLRLTERPIAIVAAPGSAILKIDGSVDEDGVTPLWDWVVGGDNTAEDGKLAYDADGLFTFARLTKGKILSLRNRDNLGAGESQYGRFKKLRFGIEYQCSGRWGDETFPYFQIFRNSVPIGNSKNLQRPSVEDEKLTTGEHDHQENSDWRIDDSRGLFAVETDTESIENDIDKSSGFFANGQYWAEYVFTAIDKTDGAYKIQGIRWYVLFDGKPLTALMKITLPNGSFYTKSFNEFAVPEEKVFEIKVEDVGEIFFEDIKAGNVEFRVEGTYDAGSFISLDSRLEIDSKIWMQGQEIRLGQVQDQNRTELIEVDGKGVTSRVTQVVDYSVTAREFGGWGFFNGEIDFKLFFNNAGLNDDTEIYVLNIFFEFEFQPYTESLAEGEILADVEGWESYPGLLYYDHPVDILRYILMEHFGGIDASYIDDASFAAMRASVGEIAPSVSRWMGEKRSLRELVNTLVTDINARLIFEGVKFYLLPRAEYYDVAASVLDITDQYFREISIDKERSSGQQVFNNLALYYNKRPGKVWFRRCLELNDELSQEENWVVRRETYDSWWHGVNATAVRWVGALALAWGAWKYTITKNTNPLNLIHLQRGDIAQLTHARSNLESQVAQIVGTRITGPDSVELRLAFQDALRIFQTSNCRVEVDQSSGAWMKFYCMGELLAILYNNGDFHFKNTFNMAGTSMLKGNDPSGDDLFVCQLLAGSIYALRVPLPQSAGQAWHPMAVIGSVGVVRLFGSRVRMDILNLNETINDYLEWSVDNWVKLAPDGKNVVAKFEAVTDEEDPDYPGIWTFKGSLKERAL